MAIKEEEPQQIDIPSVLPLLAVRDVVHGRPVKNVESLSNPQALEHFRNLEALRS